MGLFDFFKRKKINDETFNSEQFQNEILAFALWKFEEKGKNYNKVKTELFNINDFDLTEKQIEIIIEKLKLIHGSNETVDIKVGQIWLYKTRINEEDSRIKIFKIDNFNNEEVIHLSISNLKIRNPHNGQNLNTVGHIPISKKAFINSITKLEIQDNELPLIEEGYYDWKQAYDEGKAGVFDIEIKEVVSYIEKTMNQ